ncbi:hypothetical protein V2J09_014078 [Rumex salicifolius]
MLNSRNLIIYNLAFTYYTSSQIESWFCFDLIGRSKMEASCGTAILQIPLTTTTRTRLEVPPEIRSVSALSRDRSRSYCCNGRRRFRVEDVICKNRGMMLNNHATRRFFVKASHDTIQATEDGPIRIGILGCANIARKLSRAISLASSDAVVHAVASRSVDKARHFAASNNLPESAKMYGTYEELLDDPEVEAVYVPLPTALHVKWAVLAANKKKHVLLEKPVALSLDELDRILEACESNEVQFMDGTMWVHHPRTRMMHEFFMDEHKFGRLKNIQAIFSFAANDNFLENDIRVKPDLDGLGSLGDAGWYCIRASLLAANYELPKLVTALREAVTNDSGVILSCGASMLWSNGTQGTFHCSFLSHLTMEVTAIGTKGTLRVNDFVIPQQESFATFTTTSNTSFQDLEIGWSPGPSVHSVETEFPQEALMVKEFSGLVRNVIYNGSEPDRKWPVISRKTQAVIDAVRDSIKRGYQPVEVGDDVYDSDVFAVVD